MTDALLANRVADTTARRDRDELDLAITQLLSQFLSASSVALFRLLDDRDVKRVWRRAEVSPGGTASGPLTISEYAELPELMNFPEWRDCVTADKLIHIHHPGDELTTTLFPIRSDHEVSGVLVVKTVAAPSARDAEFVQGILKILQNHLALLDYGERDTLTNLLNRKTFEAHFHKTHRRTPAGRKSDATPHEPSWLALLDIDKFKSINDSYGHLFGDEVLLLTSQLMKQNFRGADQLFRFGGEEFVVMLEQASEAGAHIALERLRATIEAHEFPQVGKVTISIGYTRIAPGDVSTICVERADAALYYVKNNGRNNVKSYEDLIATGELSVKADDSDIELF